MNKSAPFLVYNASAGSGKTYALVQSFLEQLFTHPNPEYYRYILAITFTNKAVTEMKSRILKVLVQFSKGDDQEPAGSMSNYFQKELGLTQDELRSQSQKILKQLLNNYALFSVETIDHFNHRILRTFSHDLGLKSNFEVSLDTAHLLAEAVDLLVDKAGEVPEITKWLVQYALQKTEEDKSWDISRDLNEAAKLLTRENDLVFMEKLRAQSLQSFASLKEKLNKSTKAFEKKLKEKAVQLLEEFHRKDLNASHFSGGHLYKYFEKITNGNVDISIDLKWQDNVGVNNLYAKKFINTPEGNAIEELVPQIAEVVHWIRSNYGIYLKDKNLLTQIVPLATVHLVDEQLQELKSTYNLLPISEFNNLIHKEIKDQPAPFIYERLGERYKHFFIDEFQDTSLLQWSNLMPLVENNFASVKEKKEGSLMIVGDAKQSIYRWRGGLPEQFISLYSGYNPFPNVAQEIVTLDTNYRSCKEVVAFNNDFFTYLSEKFDDPLHQILYKKGNEQKSHHSCNGYVQLDLLENSNAEETLEIHSDEVVERVKELMEREFRASDICVLTRKRKEGVAVSEALSKAGIKVISEETLLLKNASNVQVLIDLLHLSLHPSDDEAKIRILEFLVKSQPELDDEFHSMAETFIGKAIGTFESLFKKFDKSIELRKTHSLGVYESMEYFIQCLKLNEKSDAFLVFFMDWVFQFAQNPMNSKWELLEFWELKKKELSISVPNDGKAVRVMTIHKAKGLEFPVVIFPFAHLDIYNDKNTQIWYPYNKNGFEELPISYKKEIASYDEVGAQLYQDHRRTLELDNLNLLYVALTRAQQELYIVANESSTNDKLITYSDFFEDFLKTQNAWVDGKKKYPFGEQQSPIFQEDFNIASEYFDYPLSFPKERGLTLVGSSNFLHDTLVPTARIFGSVFHDFMAEIKHSKDLESAWDIISNRTVIPDEQREIMQNTAKRIIENPTLNELFNHRELVETEKDVITPRGVIRPDRINMHEDNSVTVIDYKTGAIKDADKIQLKTYCIAMENMGYRVRNSYLVYVNPEEIVVNKN